MWTRKGLDFRMAESESKSESLTSESESESSKIGLESGLDYKSVFICARVHQRFNMCIVCFVQFLVSLVSFYFLFYAYLVYNFIINN